MKPTYWTWELECLNDRTGAEVAELSWLIKLIPPTRMYNWISLMSTGCYWFFHVMIWNLDWSNTVNTFSLSPNILLFSSKIHVGRSHQIGREWTQHWISPNDKKSLDNSVSESMLLTLLTWIQWQCFALAFVCTHRVLVFLLLNKIKWLM